MTNNKMSQFIDLIKSAEHIVYFTGAGVSTQAGIPDFRSQAGLYNQLKKQGMPSPEYMLSRDYFDKDPAGFYDFQ